MRTPNTDVSVDKPHPWFLSWILCKKVLWKKGKWKQYRLQLLLYNELAISFWLAKSVGWIFKIRARDVITADYAIIMSRTLKVTCNHVMYDRIAWFLKVIMSSLHALCSLPPVEKQNHDSNFFRSMYNNTIIRLRFCDIQNNRGLGKGYQPQPLASADNPYLALDYSGYHKNLFQ